jgi:hypothetical protein
VARWNERGSWYYRDAEVVQQVPAELLIGFQALAVLGDVADERFPAREGVEGASWGYAVQAGMELSSPMTISRRAAYWRR